MNLKHACQKQKQKKKEKKLQKDKLLNTFTIKFFNVKYLSKNKVS